MGQLYKIDTSAPVLVTGATGYVAGVLIKELLENGVTVHGTVRDPSNTKKFQHLADIADKTDGTFKAFKGDLLSPGSFEDAMKGCAVVFHTASPFVMTVEDPAKDLVEPAVEGTRNVLRQCTATPTVKRVVLTSSCAAIYGDCSDTQKAPGKVLNEDVWNTTSSLTYGSYSYSKTMAEKAAWVEAGSQAQWKLVVINPGLVMGPGAKYHESSESFKLMKQMIDGTMAAGCPRFGMPVVDVRDVSRAHIAAAYKESAAGRHVLAGYNTNFYDMGASLRDESKFANMGYGFPARPVPWWVLWVVGPYATPPMERATVYNNVDVPINFDHSKAKRELGIQFDRPLVKTLEDMIDQLLDLGVVERKGKAL